MNRKNDLTILKMAALILVLLIIIIEGQREIRAIDFSKTIILIRSLPKSSVLIFFCFGLIGIAATTLYDFIIVKHLKLNIRPMIVFNVSFVANTINNISGLGGLTGASIRAVFFKDSVNSSEDIINYNLLLVPATGIGLSVMALFSLVNYKYAAPLLQNHRWLFIGLILFIVFLLLYFFISPLYYFIKKEPYQEAAKKLMSARILLLAASILEWLIAYAFFAFLVREFSQDANLYSLFVIFTIASIAGIVSLLPGGAGSYDLVVLVGLKYHGVSIEHALAIIILYRTFYYFIPLVTGIILTLVMQLRNENSAAKFLKMPRVAAFINQTSTITIFLLRILVFLSGLVLLVSALLPGIAERIRAASQLLSFPILRWSHQLSICIGILLIAISGEIGMKMKRAYKFTFWLLLLGAVFTFIKGFDYEEALFLGIVLALLVLSKKKFYRKSSPFNWFRTVVILILAFIGITLYIKLGHIIFLNFLRKHSFVSSVRREMFSFHQRQLIAYVPFAAFLVFWELSKLSIKKDARYEKADEADIIDFLKQYEGNYLTHLAFLKDKHVFWGASHQVMILFEKSHHVIIVLGDPIGNREYFSEALAEFQAFIDEYGYKAAFYQVSEALLAMYHDHGYNFFKLGEMALIDLDNFGLEGPKYRNFRNVMSRFKRDGYSFEAIEQEMTEELFTELKQVSDEWLDGRKEMGFSLGRFERDYLKRSPMAVVKNIETNEMIAFASVMPSYDGNQSASIDLMRFKKDVPSNTMMFLILNLLMHYKEKGYKTFSLGMAPLANVGETRNAHVREKIAHFVCERGNRFYSFGGLRSYKEKFEPKWEGRYLAYEDMALLPASLIEATLLIHSKRKTIQ